MTASSSIYDRVEFLEHENARLRRIIEGFGREGEPEALPYQDMPRGTIGEVSSQTAFQRSGEEGG